MTSAPAAMLRALLIVAVLVAGVLVPFASTEQRADALSAADWDAGNIISDAAFYDGAAMTEAEIQRFLESMIGSCQNSNCLAVYRENTPTRTWSFGTCSTYAGGTGESAARIIFKVQQACTLSAKVILVTLQKEQSLLTNPAPSDGVMRKAMGYGCPDTAACDSTYYGFFNQIFAAGRQLTWYGNPAGSFTSIRVGQVNRIQYHPDASCGTKDVLVRNRATAALYYYTPYTPNAAALANLTGTGDACSAYGNRNFWVFYNSWFGSPTSGANPIGNLELVSAQPGTFRVVGWALDPDTSASIDVHVYVGATGAAYTANRNRSDIGAAYPAAGSAHGFDIAVPVTGPGSASVCVYAMNYGAGANVLLGCSTVAALTGPPVGALTTVTTGPGTVAASGWAIDPDTASPIGVHVYVDGSGVATTASNAIDGIDPAYAAYGREHGFAVSVAAAPGSHQVCAYAINTGPGANVQLGCQTVTVPANVIAEQGRAPVGALESVVAGSTGVTAKGWAIDPDTAAPIPVHVYVDATGAAFTANVPRTDLPAAWAAYGTGHGFEATMAAEPGTRNVCAYAINTSGAPVLLGCRQVELTGGIADQGRVPIGNLEAVRSTAPRQVSVSGWAIDPDTVAPISVHVYVGATGTSTTANGDRPDVAAVYPAYGSKHGFSWTGAVAPGSYNVCAYAINNGSGGNVLLGCSTVTVAPEATPPPPTDSRFAPIGNLEAAARADGGVAVSGWALDPDTSASIDVHVYVDSSGTALRATGSRADVAAAFGLGPDHGFSAVLPMGAGQHRVCAYAIDATNAPPAAIGCIDVP
jgi:hypothetical protein